MIEQVLAGMEKLSNQLNLEFDFSTANHNYEKGIPLENALKDFFRPYFPLKFGFGSGYLVDEKKAVSSQCDWVIYDALNVSPLFSNRVDIGTEWYPFDGVYGTIEVKRSLTVDQFDKAVQQILSVKKLYRHPNHIFNPHLVIPFKNEWIGLKKDAEIPKSNEVYSGIFSFAVGNDQKSKKAFTPEKLLDDLINNYDGVGYNNLPDFVVINNDFIVLKVKLLKNPENEMIWRYHAYPAAERNGFAWLKTQENTAGYFFMNLLSQFSMMQLLYTYQLELLNTVSRFMEDNLPNNGELFINKSNDDST